MHDWRWGSIWGWCRGHSLSSSLRLAGRCIICFSHAFPRYVMILYWWYNPFSGYCLLCETENRSLRFPCTKHTLLNYTAGSLWLLTWCTVTQCSLHISLVFVYKIVVVRSKRGLAIIMTSFSCEGGHIPGFLHYALLLPTTQSRVHS